MYVLVVTKLNDMKNKKNYMETPKYILYEVVLVTYLRFLLVLLYCIGL